MQTTKCIDERRCLLVEGKLEDLKIIQKHSSCASQQWALMYALGLVRQVVRWNNQTKIPWAVLLCQKNDLLAKQCHKVMQLNSFTCLFQLWLTLSSRIWTMQWRIWASQLTRTFGSTPGVWGSNIFAATKAYKKLMGHHQVHIFFLRK